MREEEVKEATEKWLTEKGYKIQREVGVSGTEREVILDLYGYKEEDGRPEILWVECKGDQTLSELLEGFIRLEFGVWLGGGIGILAVPHNATRKLLNYKKFLGQAETIISVLDVEDNRLIKLNQK